MKPPSLFVHRDKEKSLGASHCHQATNHLISDQNNNETVDGESPSVQILIIDDAESASGLFLAICLALQDFSLVAFDNACNSIISAPRLVSVAARGIAPASRSSYVARRANAAMGGSLSSLRNCGPGDTMNILKAADIGDAALLRQVGRSATHRPVQLTTNIHTSAHLNAWKQLRTYSVGRSLFKKRFY